MILTLVVSVANVLSALALILLVLLHSGRGGGLSDMLGGSIGSATAGSTVVERNLDRLTVIATLIFSFTAIALGIRLQ